MERWLVGFARYLVAQGADVTVLCNEVREDLQGEPGVRFTHLPMARAAKMLTLWRSARRALERGGFDAVMGFGRTPGHQLFRAGNGSHADFLRRNHRFRRWFSPVDWLEAALDQRAVEGARIVMANSRLGAEGIRRDYRPKRVEIVYNGVDLARFAPDPGARSAMRSALGMNGPTAVFLGSGFRRKGLDVAISALPASWQLYVVGNDPAFRAPPNVRFLGPVLAPERILQSADVMILPTRYDPFANSCLEALACGVPVLTTSSNGAAEILPEKWMIADNLSDFRAGFQMVSERLTEASLRDVCRRTAEQFPAAACYERSFALLQQASS